MTLAECLRRLAVGSPPPAPEVGQLHSALVDTARALVHCADLGPHPRVADQLRHLALDATSAAERLAAALKALGVALPPTRNQPPIAQGLNHWARLVRILERQRELRAQLLEATIRHGETHRPLVALLDRLAQEQVRSIQHLRDLVAQADPQALD